MTSCTKCNKPCEYTGPFPELLALCEYCRSQNLAARSAGRPISSKYPVGELIPGTELTPLDYSVKPPVYQCTCGRQVQLEKSLVEYQRKKTCGHCVRAKCVFCCNRVIDPLIFHTKAVCGDCLCELLSLNSPNDLTVAGQSQEA